MERFENVQPEHDGYYIKDSVCELHKKLVIKKW